MWTWSEFDDECKCENRTSNQPATPVLSFPFSQTYNPLYIPERKRRRDRIRSVCVYACVSVVV
jgi:hypothetical protein